MPHRPDTIDVVRTAWAAFGSPRPAGIEFGASGECARCGTESELAAAGDIVSAHWTGWDTWSTARAPRLCAACAWSYRNPSHRRDHLEIHRDGTVRVLDAALLADALATLVGSHRAITIITTPNRKHALPVARWGQVAVDDTVIAWNRPQPARLDSMAWLRRRGFGSRALAQPSPPYAVLRRQPAAVRAKVLARWSDLDSWRASAPHWRAGVAASSHLTIDTTGAAA